MYEAIKLRSFFDAHTKKQKTFSDVPQRTVLQEYGVSRKRYAGFLTKNTVLFKK